MSLMNWNGPMTSIPSRWARPATLALIFALAACGGKKDEAAPAEATPAPAPEATPAEAAGPPKSIDIEAARSRAKTAMFVPAPSEFQAALKATGAAVDMKALIADTDKPLDGRSKPLIALETGRRVASLLITVHDGDKASIEKRLKGAKDALAALGAPAELTAELDKAIADFVAGSIAQSELVPVLDLIALRVQREIEKNAGAEVSTLVQAGLWVQAVHLLSTALDKSGTAGDAAALMRQPTVVRHFTEFLKGSAPAQSGDADVLAVLAEMQKLEVVAVKPELLAEDVKLIAAATGAILARF